MEAAFVELSQAAEELGDIPDHFMCPISCDIMRDPVTLPTSGQVRRGREGKGREGKGSSAPKTSEASLWLELTSITRSETELDKCWTIKPMVPPTRYNMGSRFITKKIAKKKRF